ncbi:Cas10/Cmr2 second palm domain-containing protein [Crassaminicella indica]|uniref:GGDEF domain-containing protein n=1 Tax=Crassaminicella indica TaxID=2855394 RepID=A0ABX8R8L6_9CLOT|nr:type III-B CRISPR-associated protein Cas10/Cmr2 [Crassaminicella indica]QXM05368.1 hypothetical protein KVH43_08175 [Crassaminicella indica]
MSYLLGVTIGPVQTYIQESKKLLDLYNSSKIISNLMKNVYKYIKGKNANIEVIYPNYQDIQGVDYSNYIVFEIPEIIDLNDIEEKIYKEVNESVAKEYECDLKEVFYLFWAIEQIKNNGYYEAYKELTRFIKSLKNTYEFDQNLQEKGKKKCLICGKRNITDKKSKDKEELCRLCLFKRNYKERNKADKNKFLSVDTIAIEPWKRKNKEKIKEITAKLSELFLEADKYYNPNEIDNIINTLEKINKFHRTGINQGIEKDLEKKLKKIKGELKGKKDLKEILEGLKSIRKIMNDVYNDEKVSLPSYEYCFIQFDIDNLGRLMSGEYLDGRKDLKTYQKDFSRILIKFGSVLVEALKNTACQIIYSGGDDFLGVMPKEEIIRVVEIIDKIFKEQVPKEYEEYVTYSMSITIGQCKDPMSYVLRKTRAELEKVKKRFEKKEIEKNGMAITYIINNSKEITCYLQRENSNRLLEIIKSFELIKNRLSFSYIYHFEKMLSLLKHYNLSFEELRSFLDITKCELRRFLLRSKNVKEKDDQEVVDKYIQNFVDFIEDIIYSNREQISANSENIDFKNIINIMHMNEKLSKIDFQLNKVEVNEK